jgi:hypothetical protein
VTADDEKGDSGKKKVRGNRDAMKEVVLLG